MREVSSIFKALADETRLQIMALLLKKEEVCVCDFEQVLGVSQSRASRHLRYLLNAGLVEDRREGIWVYYRLDPRMDSDRKAIMKALGSLLSEERTADLDQKLARWLKKKAESREKKPRASLRPTFASK